MASESDVLWAAEHRCYGHWSFVGHFATREGALAAVERITAPIDAEVRASYYRVWPIASNYSHAH